MEKYFQTDGLNHPHIRSTINTTRYLNNEHLCSLESTICGTLSIQDLPSGTSNTSKPNLTNCPLWTRSKQTNFPLNVPRKSQTKPGDKIRINVHCFYPEPQDPLSIYHVLAPTRSAARHKVLSIFHHPPPLEYLSTRCKRLHNFEYRRM